MINYTIAKQRKFVDLLYKKTTQQHIKWQLNSENQIYTTIATHTLFVIHGQNSSGEDLIEFRLFAKDGRQTEYFTDESLVGDGIVPAKFESWYSMCAALSEMVERQASGADNVLDAMIAELDDDVPF